MAKEWYLLKSPHDQISGYEDEAFDDYGQEGFFEALDSFIATDVKLYNYDLSKCTELRAVIQNALTDTKLKSLVRHALVPIGTCVAGDYFNWDNRFWIVVSVVDNNGVYEKAILSLCNYKLTWINSSGAIVQRWTNITSASQYNNGETASRYYTLRTDQLMVVMPNDTECLLLHIGQRFIIDKRCEIYESTFDDSIQSNTENEVITYKITRVDSILYDYTNGGLFQLLVTQDEQHEKDGYYKVNKNGYWLCYEPAEPDVSIPSSCKIVYDSDEIYNGLDAGVFLARFYDNDGNEISAIPTWEIVSDYTDYLIVSYDEDRIYIAANNKKLINKQFVLNLTCDNFEPDSITITVRSFI